jgi:hypothetical protein
MKNLNVKVIVMLLITLFTTVAKSECPIVFSQFSYPNPYPGGHDLIGTNTANKIDTKDYKNCISFVNYNPGTSRALRLYNNPSPGSGYGFNNIIGYVPINNINHLLSESDCNLCPDAPNKNT